ncbi:hypothetical protein EMGBS15_01780 [Filimonas sp.]|nr:hypothetical protein EMGBS15_01780 [Filimonas sp.]
MFRSIIQHLRFAFSILLLPIFLFALVELKTAQINVSAAVLLFVLLHLLVYPSSNAYNSLQDKDQGSIGLVKSPLPAAKELVWVTLVMDIAAVLLSLLINGYTALGVFVYILFSRLYSHRGIRLKKYPLIGFLTVFIFQGFWIYVLVQYAVGGVGVQLSYLMAICASCLIGAMYPLSQIYQHQQDKEDGVTSMSYLLGYRGTFLFSGLLFLAGTFIYVYSHLLEHRETEVTVFMICQMPVVLFFLYWFVKVWKETDEADFKNTMRMNIIASFCMNISFIILFCCKQ